MADPAMTLYVDVKPSDTLRQLMALAGGGSTGGGGGTVGSTTGGAGGGNSGGPGGIWKILKDLGLKQIIGITSIAAGVAMIVSQLFKSSAILQGTFKIFQLSFMLMIKPYADFLGMLLRPIAMAFLMFAIPFYRTLGPAWMKAAIAITNFITKPSLSTFGAMLAPDPNAPGTKAINAAVADIQKAIQGIAPQINAFATSLGLDLSPIPAKFAGYFASFGKLLGINFTPVPKGIIAYFTDLGKNLGAMFDQVPGMIVKTFTDLGTNLINFFQDIPGRISGAFQWIVDQIRSSLQNIGSAIWNAIMSAVNAAIKGLGGLIGGGGQGGNQIHGRTVAGMVATTTTQQL